VGDHAGGGQAEGDLPEGDERDPDECFDHIDAPLPVLQPVGLGKRQVWSEEGDWVGGVLWVNDLVVAPLPGGEAEGGLLPSTVGT
jgi:hypothetical protein